MKIIAFLFTAFISLQMSGQEKFPDGTPIPDWFRQNEIVNIDTLGKKYTITDYGVTNDSTILQTEKIQAVIDRAAENGGGVIIIPKGTFLSGSIFFKPKTHLYMEEGAVLKGSDDISNFAIVNTRIEGQSLKYFAALVNADKVNGFTISGKGSYTINPKKQTKNFAAITPFSMDHGAWDLYGGTLNLMRCEPAFAYTGNYYARDYRCRFHVMAIAICSLDGP